MIDAVQTTGAPATAEIARQIRDAAEERRPLRIVGAGTWLDGGAPVAATDTVSCASNQDIIEYVPGDLTITVGAGTPLAEIARVTADNDQWLTLDPMGSTSGSIGATVATASFGPLATGFGTPRDLVLGIEAVTGTGAIIRGGGRVVKNVAGFDLTRMFTGSRGTLGAITEVTLRLRARPAHDVTVGVAIDDTLASVRRVSEALRGWPFTPMAAELIDGACAGRLDLARATTLLFRLGGNARAVNSQRNRVAGLGKVFDVEGTVWERLRSIEAGCTAVIRLADLPSSFADRWDAARQLCGSTGVTLGSPARGIVRCAAADFELPRVAHFRERAPTAAIVYDVLPAAAWPALTTEIDSKSLAGRVRAAFDPAGILNPGAMRAAR
jgi:glycolate oxidase FAD binding subunit